MLFRDVKPGMKIKVRQWGGQIVDGVVEGCDLEGKNDAALIDYRALSGREAGESKWCYLNQVVSHRIEEPGRNGLDF